MKKVLGGSLLFLSLLFFTACGKNVTTEDLKANDWLIEATNDDETNMIASFSDHVVSLSFDTSEMKSTASNEWEALGEDFAKNLVEQMNYKFEYTLKNNEMVWKDEEDKDNDAKYTVSKDEKNLILTPDKNNKSDDNEKLTLKPYKKKKSTKTTETTNSSSIEQSSSTVSSITETSVEQASTNTSAVNDLETTYSSASIENYVENNQESYVAPTESTPASIQQSVPQDYAPANVTEPSSSAPEVQPVGPTTIILQAGEGPKQVAERAGITVDQLFALNGMDPNNYLLYPGQELRVK
ncbi:LysM peptidoglycan-binding domain-containing protein [Enterococcus thailandicus]|uniref:Peptidoglycan-binding protein LysM n=1 Tax=Enterococcus thailandicus TaxID=417368 RepID=A0A179EQM0_ENTTH|nr:LysM peptidoglycan-binding domain-containing protein [Enterococcus thailandicus]OAQ55531.1 peptidoglycan-binding protein LysM [Enterococcus thailandicus]